MTSSCLQGKSPKKRKLEDKFADSKSLKTEESPFKTKKPIRLKKTVHPRKKLQSNQDSVIFTLYKYLNLTDDSYRFLMRMPRALAPEHPQKEGAGADRMASITMTSTRERVNSYNSE